MDVTIIPTQLAIDEAMHAQTLNTILTICEQNQITPAELVTLAHRLAQRDANADAFTGAFYANSSSNH
nr:hypothetical protein [Pantoea cypripedii]